MAGVSGKTKARKCIVAVVDKRPAIGIGRHLHRVRALATSGVSPSNSLVLSVTSCASRV